MEGSQQPVVLRTWNMESPHNYENSRHETTVFVCPGATSFEVEFDERCETEKRWEETFLKCSAATLWQLQLTALSGTVMGLECEVKLIIC